MKHERIDELVEQIKSEIYCELRQKFEADEVKSIYKKIDKAVTKAEKEFGRKSYWSALGDDYFCEDCGEAFGVGVHAADYDPIEDFGLKYCPACGAEMEY
jgi:predicted RNA-binding Zn-ribbon protein involved in translation (DUF1610 family)